MTDPVQNDGRLEMEILGRIWQFGRNDGSVIAANVRLLRGGAIFGYNQPNESSWRINNGSLEFLNRSGAMTTRFDSMKLDERGAMSLFGKFCPNPKCIHVLKELRTFIKLGPANVAPRVALLVRTHVVNEKLLDLLDVLNQSRRYDLYVTADETKNKLDLRGFEKLSHTAGDSKRLGLPSVHDRILWHCGDFPLYFSYLDRPDYDYYIMVEYDVDFVRKSALFVEGLISRFQGYGPTGVDLVTVNMGVAYPGWAWAASASKSFPIVYTTGTFAFLAVSRNALLHMLEARRREASSGAVSNDIIHCEAFCASILMHSGYECTSVNCLIDNAVDRTSFHPGSIDMQNSAFLLNHYRLENPKVEMVHPVYELAVYLEKQFQKSLRTKSLPAYLESLSRLNLRSKNELTLLSKYQDRIREHESKYDTRPPEQVARGNENSQT